MKPTFFSVVDEGDLLAAAEAAGVEQAVCSCPEKCAAGAVNTDCPVCSVNMGKCVGAEPEPEPAPEPEPEPEKPGNAGMILLVLAVMGIGGGAAWYFKIYRPKHQQADQPEEDDGGEYPDYDEFEDDGPPVGRGGRSRRKGGNQMNFTSSPFERMMKKTRPRLPLRTGRPGAPPVMPAVTGGDRLCVLLQGAFEAGAGGR